jgi:hypothetical protein
MSAQAMAGAYETAYTGFALGLLDELLAFTASIAQPDVVDVAASPPVRAAVEDFRDRVERWHAEHPPPAELLWPPRLPGNLAMDAEGDARASAALHRLMATEIVWKQRLDAVADGAPLRRLFEPLS